jgi:hypothetical protein
MIRYNTIAPVQTDVYTESGSIVDVWSGLFSSER